MNKKAKATAFVVILFLLIGAFVVYILTELFTEEEINNNKKPTITDAIKFKEEYESQNGEKRGEKTIRTIEIPEENPMIYKTAEEIAEMIDNKETFIVYFGFNTCPWCRSVLPFMIESAKKNNIDKIYYVDVLEIRDKYELDDNHKAIKTVEGSEGYNKLLKQLDNVLSDYGSLTYTNNKKKEVKVTIKEKRIFAPNVVIVKNGKAVTLETGIPASLKDPYQVLSDTTKCEIKELFDCFFEKANDDKNSCDIKNPVC